MNYIPLQKQNVSDMKIAIIGSTGLVGQKMIKVLEERNFPTTKFLPVASQKSIGKELMFRNKPYKIISIDDAIAQKPHFAIFSAGSNVSLAYAPAFAKQGTFVIDNSSAWRMFPNKKLIIPEVNGEILTINDKIIANPNCSTIQLVMAIAPLHRKYKIKRLVISTYQSVTGTGYLAVEQLMNERKGINSEKVYPYQIDLNCFPHGGVFTENGYTSEEMKLENETRKILGDDSIAITSTVVRVPIVGGHSEAVNIEFEHDFDLEVVVDLLRNSPGIIVQDNTNENIYPMPLFAHDKDEVFVGRIRRDFSLPKSINMWIVADNLRKGAATNAIQIAETILKKKFV
jgi:aspartate-semialdehyde dehydrogenase